MENVPLTSINLNTHPAVNPLSRVGYRVSCSILLHGTARSNLKRGRFPMRLVWLEAFSCSDQLHYILICLQCSCQTLKYTIFFARKCNTRQTRNSTEWQDPFLSHDWAAHEFGALGAPLP